MKKSWLLFSSILLLFSCSSDSDDLSELEENPEDPSSEVIIDNAVEETLEPITASNEAFITTWTGTTVTIPINDRFSYNYNIDWDNDGIIDESDITGEVTNTYTTEGPHTIQITGKFPVINFGSESTGDPDAIIDVVQWGTGEWFSMINAFKDCTSLEITAIDVPDFSNVTDMSLMFNEATSANPDVSNWDTSNVTSMIFMFSNATSANPDVSNWNTESVTNMSSMFSNATSANPDVSNWDTSNVTAMSSMFNGATSANPDVSNWDTSNVTNIISMFRFATLANPDVSNWDTSNVTDIVQIFQEATSANPDVSSWDTSNVTAMSNMFNGATSADPDVSSWNTSNVTTMNSMFEGATSANPDVSNWDTSNVINMRTVFRFATLANPDVSNWDTSNVTTMNSMFSSSGITTPDFSNWDISNVTNMDRMFSGITLSTKVYDQILEDFSSKPHNFDLLFEGGNSTYCNTAARNILVNDGWVITDDGLDTNCVNMVVNFDPNTGILTGPDGTKVQIQLIASAASEDVYEGDLLISTSEIENDGSLKLVTSTSSHVDNIENTSPQSIITLNESFQYQLSGTHTGPSSSATRVEISVDGVLIDSFTMTNGSGLPLDLSNF